jgi:hypothetical protein
MANVFATPDKVRVRKQLFQAGIETLQKDGWKVERIPRRGKSSLRRITKGGKSLEVAIRTTQDTYIAFPRNEQDNGWVTLSDVDAVVAVSVDDRSAPRFAQVHMIDGDDMRDRFDRAYAARLAAGHSIPVGRGVWVPLYLPDADSPPAHVGGGAGLDNSPIARIPLRVQDLGRSANGASPEDVEGLDDGDLDADDSDDAFERLTIGEAKRRLALSLGVNASNIKITVEA